jgi:hypothetical protein
MSLKTIEELRESIMEAWENPHRNTKECYADVEGLLSADRAAVAYAKVQEVRAAIDVMRVNLEKGDTYERETACALTRLKNEPCLQPAQPALNPRAVKAADLWMGRTALVRPEDRDELARLIQEECFGGQKDGR